VTITPPSGTALTDATGTAAVQITAASLASAGAATLSASSQVGSAAVNGSIGFSIGAANVTITGFAFGINPLSAFGTTSVSVTVNSNGTPVTAPQTVSFSSPCASAGKAVLTASVLTGAGGVATASYRDNGCGGNDVVTASVSGLVSSSQTLTVVAPTAGSIQFISATPTSITLKGTGGAGRQETSQVIFKVVDNGGNPLATSQVVNFTLSTAVGGVSFSNGLSTATANSDPTTGQAVVTVQSGTIATPVRVLATTAGAAGATLSTQSDQLTITTGIPDQASFSLSTTVSNIEGWAFDGTQAILTARLADHFGNPVPDGTAVNFTTEGGSVGNNGLGACTTAQGSCTVTFTSQNLRPSNGRVTLLAYAVGEESFTDLDGDGLASKVNHATGTTELVDANGVTTDMPEAFVDWNENGLRDANEPFIDFNNNGAYDAPDGFYNGVLCNSVTGTSSPGTCSAQKTIHVFRNIVEIFSGSDAFISFYSTRANAVAGAPTMPSINFLGACGATQTIFMRVIDVNNNVMPAGTTIAVAAAANATVDATTANFTVPSSTACLTGAAGCPPCPAPAVPPLRGVTACSATSFEPIIYAVTVSSAAVSAGGVCTLPSPSVGPLSVTVTTPTHGIVTRASIQVID